MHFRSLSLLAIWCALTVSGCGGDVPSDSTSRQLASSTIVNNTVVFPNNRSSYVIGQSSGGYTVTDNAGSGGTTAIGSDIQTLVFADVTVNLRIGEKSQAISNADLKTLVELYIAFFNRVPDADGLSYWIDQFRGGRSVDLIAESFYDAALQSSSLTGYSSSMTNSDFVKIIYKNVLGRSGATAPPDADVAYWAGELANGNRTRGSLIRTMLSSAHSFKGDSAWGWVADLLDNKYTVGSYFAVQQGLNYRSADESITQTMAIAGAVTASNTTAAVSLIEKVAPASNAAYQTVTANAGSTQSATAGNSVTLNGSASKDATGLSIAYSWSFSSKPIGSAAALINASTAYPSFTPDVAGQYVVALKVTAGGVATGSATVTISVSARTPSYPAGATAICKDGTYSYSLTRSGTCSHHGGVAQWL